MGPSSVWLHLQRIYSQNLALLSHAGSDPQISAQPASARNLQTTELVAVAPASYRLAACSAVFPQSLPLLRVLMPMQMGTNNEGTTAANLYASGSSHSEGVGSLTLALQLLKGKIQSVSQ